MIESVFTPYQGVVSGDVTLLYGTEIMCDVNIGRGVLGGDVYALCGFQISALNASLPVLGKKGDHPLWALFHSYRINGRKIAEFDFGVNLDSCQMKRFIKRVRVFIRPYKDRGLEVGLNLELSGVGRKKVFLLASDELDTIILLPSIFKIEGHSLISYQEAVKKLRR